MQSPAARNGSPADKLDEAGWRRQLRRAAVASAIGTGIEWYDFFLYGSAAALIFPKLFFPNHDAFTSALLALSTYFVGFVSRPLGAVIFGHWGDRVGRKATLITTLLTMGLATFFIGLVPTYARAGAWGGALLVFLRIVQGIGVGGEWGGSALIALEWARGKRGLAASWAQFGVPVGLLLSNGALAACRALSGSAFDSWGWRVPFFLSLILVLVGLYIRLGILETPVFQRVRAERWVATRPVLEVMRTRWREVLLTALLRTSEMGPFYLFTVFVFSFTTQEHLSSAIVLGAVTVSACVELVTIPLFGALSDRIGRRRLTMWGIVAMGAWAFAYYGLLSTAVPVLAFLAIVVSLPLHDLQYGPQAAFISEAFPDHLRYSGASLGYQLASLTAGGPAPLLALYLLNRFHSGLAIAIYVFVAAVISFIAAYLLPDRSKAELSV